MGWRAFIDKERKVVFFWNQKAACTTLHFFLMDNLTPRPKERSYFLGHCKDFNVARRFVREEGFKSVILVRHPVTRAVSAYFNKFVIFEGHRLMTRTVMERVSTVSQVFFDQWQAMSGATGDDNNMTFEDFLKTVAHIHAERKDPNEPVNGHWDTQIPQAVVDTGFRYDHVLYVESLSNDLAKLARKLDMTYEPRNLNATPKAKTAINYVGDRPARLLTMEDLRYENFYSPETLAMMYKIYGRDYRKFGYGMVPKSPEFSWQDRLKMTLATRKALCEIR